MSREAGAHVLHADNIAISKVKSRPLLFFGKFELSGSGGKEVKNIYNTNITCLMYDLI